MAAVQLQRWQFTVDEYHELARLGFFGPDGGEDARVELIDGEIVVMSPIGRKHSTCVNQFAKRIGRLIGDELLMSVQNPILLGDNAEPQPDLVVARDHGPDGPKIVPADVLLLIEVADSTLLYDRNVKLPLYAAAGIPEVWIADLNGGRILRYADPRGGRYQDTAQARHGETLASLTLPAITIVVDDVLPTGGG